jgi:hypothetical protein
MNPHLRNGGAASEKTLTMEERLQKIFDSVPLDEPRSRLEPYRELILRWRKQGRTYHRIRQLLAEQCDVKVAYVTLYRFIQRRSRSRPMDAPPETQPCILRAVALNEESPLRPARRSPEEVAAMREAARASHHKPVFTPEEPKELFVYDPDKPLTNKPS